METVLLKELLILPHALLMYITKITNAVGIEKG